MKEFFVELVMREVPEVGPSLLQRLVGAAMAADVGFCIYKQPVTLHALEQALERGEWATQDVDPQTNAYRDFDASFSLDMPGFADVISSFSLRLSTFSPPKPYWTQLRVGGLLDFELKDQRHLIAAYADRILELARVLYPLAQPQLGYVDNFQFVDNDPRDVKKLRLKALGWATFFSPAYVQRYGADFLLGLPGYRTERLDDGGVFFQLSPSILAADKREAEAMRERVVAYCAAHGLKLSCRAPYVIPGALDTAPATADEMVAAEQAGDPAAEVRELLHTTFVLDDGVRLKSVYLSWDDWSEQQRAAVLEVLREALPAELRAHGGRLQLELNELPLAVEQALVALFGRDNPEVGWAVVEL